MSYDNVTPPTMPPPVATAPASSGGAGKTCLIVGGIGCLVVIVLVVVVSLIGFFAAKGFMEELVAEYTDTEPVALPEEALSDEVFGELSGRVDAFVVGVEEGAATDPLVLTADEINALIQQHPDWEDLKGKVYITMEDDEIGGEVSFPLGELGWDMFQGRYFNGTATFRISLDRGFLGVFLTSMSLKGEPLPEEVMQGFRAQNLAQDQQNNPQLQPVIDALESIEVEDGKLILTPKQPDE